MHNIYKIVKKILCSKCSCFLLTIFGMLLSVLYTEISLYRIFSGKVFGMARQLTVILLYLSFLVMLLTILYLLIWEWLKNCAKEFCVLILCGQTAQELYYMFSKMFILWYLLMYVVGSTIFYICSAQVLWTVCSVGSGFAILLLLQLVFMYTVIRRYFRFLLRNSVP